MKIFPEVFAPLAPGPSMCARRLKTMSQGEWYPNTAGSPKYTIKLWEYSRSCSTQGTGILWETPLRWLKAVNSLRVILQVFQEEFQRREAGTGAARAVRHQRLRSAGWSGVYRLLFGCSGRRKFKNNWFNSLQDPRTGSAAVRINRRHRKLAPNSWWEKR